MKFGTQKAAEEFQQNETGRLHEHDQPLQYDRSEVAERQDQQPEHRLFHRARGGDHGIRACSVCQREGGDGQEEEGR